MKNNTIVTALYFTPAHTRIGGRGYSFYHYAAPFKNLLNLDANLVVYSHSTMIPFILQFFKNNEFKDFKIIEYDLDNHKYSKDIYRLKEETGIIDKHGLKKDKSLVDNDRNTHLCLSKIDFLNDTIKNNYFKTENYYWIDGGLFHHGIFPESLGGMERFINVNQARFYPTDKNNICTPELLNTIQKKTKGNLTLLGFTRFHGSPRGFEKLYSEGKKIHIVGGLFGGKKEEVEDLIKKFNKVLDEVFKNNILTLEEEVLSCVYTEYLKEVECLKFTHWGHDKQNERNYLGVPPGSNSFYKLFLDE